MSVLSGFVWSVADTLRGPYQEAEYGSVILPFTVLRRLECVMEPHRGVMAEIIKQYPGEQQRRTHLKRKTRTAGDTGLSFWTTSDYTLERALQDPENLADEPHPLCQGLLREPRRVQGLRLRERAADA